MAFAAVEFVGLGEQHQKLQTLFHLGANDFQQNFIEFSQTQAGVAQQHHAFQVVPCHQIVSHDTLPTHFVGLGHGGVAVAWQIGQHGVGQVLPTQCKQVDVLGATRRFRGIGQLPLLGQHIDAGGFARIRASNKRNFGLVVGGEVVQLCSGGQKASGMQPAHGLFDALRLCVVQRG